MIKKGIHIVFLLFFCFWLSAQNKSDSLVINFHLEFNKLPLQLNKKYVSASNDTLTIETFRCYISNIQIQYEDNSVFIQKESYHLLDSDNPNSFSIPITKNGDKLISKIIYNIGIDSVTNISGALAGDLDPIKGMYWAWQSGYINMKIEGKSPSCKTRRNEFQFHIGGYLQPYYALRAIEIPIPKSQIPNNVPDIVIDLGEFFSEVKLRETNSIMIPGKKAMEIADLSVKLFSVK
jgi:hypothetical protein